MDSFPAPWRSLLWMQAKSASAVVSTTAFRIQVLRLGVVAFFARMLCRLQRSMVGAVLVNLKSSFRIGCCQCECNQSLNLNPGSRTELAMQDSGGPQRRPSLGIGYGGKGPKTPKLGNCIEQSPKRLCSRLAKQKLRRSLDKKSRSPCL